MLLLWLILTFLLSSRVVLCIDLYYCNMVLIVDFQWLAIERLSDWRLNMRLSCLIITCWFIQLDTLHCPKQKDEIEPTTMWCDDYLQIYSFLKCRSQLGSFSQQLIHRCLRTRSVSALRLCRLQDWHPCRPIVIRYPVAPMGHWWACSWIGPWTHSSSVLR